MDAADTPGMRISGGAEIENRGVVLRTAVVLRDLVARRAGHVEASVVGRDHVIAGTDCGFGTSRLHPTIAHLRLQTLVEGARLALQKLWDRSEVSA